jgi:hypothetical protein
VVGYKLDVTETDLARVFVGVVMGVANEGFQQCNAPATQWR